MVTTAVSAVPDGGTVMPGVAAYGAREACRWTEQAAEAGAQAVMLLPPNAYRADEATVVAHYAEVAKVGLPIVAYNNPIDTKVDLTPELLARLHGDGLIVAVKEFTGDVRRAYEIAELAPGLDVLVGSDDVTLEVVLAGAVGWVSGYPNAFPESCVELWRACLAHDLETALPLYRQLHPLLRWDSKTEFVQAIKLSMDLVGRQGGPCRPPRGPLSAEHERGRPGGDRAGDRGRAQLMRSGRLIHTVDSHTEGMPTRVVVGGVGVMPGATMVDRRRCFLENSDDLRTLLMYEPRGHASMSGAILQPPTRPDADWGVLFIEVSGCLPMCGHGTIGVATVLVETGMVEVVEPETTIRLDTPAGLVVARVAVAGGRALSVTLTNVPSYVHELDATVEVPARGQVTYDLAFGGNFYAIVDLDRFGLAVRPVGEGPDPARRPRPHGRDQRAAPPGPPGEPRDRGVPPRLPRGARVRRRSTPGTRWRSTRAGSTVPRAAPGRARAWRSCTRGASCALGADFVNESFIGTRFIGRAVEETTVGGRPAVIPTITGRAWVTGHGAVAARPGRPVPCRLPALTGAGAHPSLRVTMVTFRRPQRRQGRRRGRSHASRAQGGGG